MSKKEWAAWILVVTLVLILNGVLGYINPRSLPHEPGTYDCCVKAWQETDKA